MFKVKKLKISGFKSFAFPSEIEIGNGVTGVIGPNGCGKSNIFEAIRWVMGESSSKSLRSGLMDDVIFSGTEKIPAKNFAEVSLELENTSKDKIKNLNEGEKILVSRTLERGVGSFYKINNKDVRAKDILILFSDSGSGPRSSSIISQGNIDQIINFKPIERKIILEDAAGISGLYSRRHESELKLIATQENLERISDSLKNLENQQKSLQRQAKQAGRYQLISDQIKENEGMLFLQEWEEIVNQHQISNKKYRETKTNLSMVQKKLETLEKLEVVKAEKTKASENKVLEIEKKLQLNSLDQKDLLNKKNFFQNRKNEINQYFNLLKKDKNLEEKRLNEVEDNTKKILKKLNGFEQLSKYKELLKNEEKQEFLLQEKLKDSESNLVTEMQLLLGEEFRLDNLKESKENYKNRERKISEEIKYIQTQIDKYDQKELLQLVNNSQKEKTHIETRIVELKKLNNENIKKESLILDKSEKIKLDIEKLTKELTEFETELLTLNRISADIDIPKNSIFNLLNIKKGYEKAIYAILKDELDAELKRSKKRWLIKPQNSPLPINNSINRHVEAPDELKLFLSQIMYVDNEEEGIKKQKELKVGQYIVNKNGTIWRWDGFVSEENNEKDKWYNSKIRVTELEILVINLKNSLKEIKSNKNKYDEVKFEITKEIENNNTEIEKCYSSLNMISSKIENLKEKSFLEKNKFEKLNEKIKFLLNESKIIKDELNNIISNEDEKNKQTNSKDSTNKSATERLILEIKLQIQNKRKIISELNEKILSQEINYKYLNNDLDQNKKRKKECLKQISDFDLREKKYKQEESKLQNFPIELENKLNSLEKDQVNIASELTSKNNDLNIQNSELENIKKEFKRLTNTKDDFKHMLIRTEENLNHLDEKKVNLKEIIFQQFKCRPEDIKVSSDNLRKLNIEEIKNNLEKFKFQREQMGPVNLRAQIEEKEISLQLNELILERNDLTEAIKKLNLAIYQINVEGKKKLIAAFDLVNKNFSELFQKLFEGGEASLKLISSDDPLKTGLEIYARPPGKKLTNISLLSGGEKTLTAISLIFSIFLINPAPICILDEVDAALDDTNVEKFCKLMDEIKTNTQTKFLIITHHKTTMAMVDRVYGVTMSQKGISDIVSVNFENQDFRKAI